LQWNGKLLLELFRRLITECNLYELFNERQCWVFRWIGEIPFQCDIITDIVVHWYMLYNSNDIYRIVNRLNYNNRTSNWQNILNVRYNKSISKA
jgi:hypothetical protein